MAQQDLSKVVLKTADDDLEIELPASDYVDLNDAGMYLVACMMRWASDPAFCKAQIEWAHREMSKQIN